MTRFLLDTDIIGNLVKPTPSDALVAWMAARHDEDLFVSALTIAEIRRGILDLPTGQRRDRLEAWFAGPEGLPALFAGRVLAFDEAAALVWARLMAEGRVMGRRRSALDTIIAATGQANGCVVVTGNEKDFAGVEVVNLMGEEKTNY